MKTMDCSAIVELSRKEAGAGVNDDSRLMKIPLVGAMKRPGWSREADRAMLDDIPVDEDDELATF